MKRLSARYIAVEILLEWERSGSPINLLLEEKNLPEVLADVRDANLVMAMVYGVLRWRGYLDGILADFSRHPLGKMKPLTLQALRIGLFQLLFLYRIPPSAAINETVQALKDVRQPQWLTGFVNGLLRNISRARKSLPPPWAEESIWKTYPQWLWDRWKKRYGHVKALEMCMVNNIQAQICLWVNSRVINREDFLKMLGGAGIAALPGEFSPEAVRLVDFKGSVAEIPGYRQGFFQVQDEAAQLVSLLLGPFEDGRYLDGCAGLGGKTSHLAQLLPGTAKLEAVEPNKRRAELLAHNLNRLTFSDKVQIYHGTLEDLAEKAKGQYRGILIDAPCSGLGVIRRHPDIRWNRKPEELQQYQEKQLHLLDIAADLLASGGILVYATCSTEPEENEQVVAKFLEAHPEFSVSDAAAALPASAAMLVDGSGFFRTVPDAKGLDGFFAARLRKK